MKKTALILGGTGMIGRDLAIKLDSCGWQVRAIGKEPIQSSFPKSIQYYEGDINDNSFFDKCLNRVTCVFYFISTTIPSSSMQSLEYEIQGSCRLLDSVIRRMMANSVYELVFPSSGGTVYGDVLEGKAQESSSLMPTTAYGVGKKLSEEIIRFYSKHGLNADILRIGNVYGASAIRNANQGVIDIFVQKALKNENISVWGGAIDAVRDYIFIDDLVDAISVICQNGVSGLNVYNVGSGEGTTLKSIIDIIQNNFSDPLKISNKETLMKSEIQRIVLDISKLKKEFGWEPKYNLDDGIKETIIRKRAYIKQQSRIIEFNV